MEIETIAREAAAAFVTGHRENGEAFRKVADDAPAWITDLVRDAAHAGGWVFPSDWRYKAVEDCLTAIAEGDDTPPEGDVYTSAQLAWLASDGEAVVYCDRAAEEGLVSDRAGLLDRIAAGQALLLSDIFGAVQAALEERAESEEGA